MAGEYSRELGVKVLEDKAASTSRFQARRRSRLRPAADVGLAGSVSEAAIGIGERKSIATDRVILVPGPPHEVQVVRDIYRMLISEKLTVHAIARELNQRAVEYVKRFPLGPPSRVCLLTHPKYTGCHIFGRTSANSTRQL